MDKQTTYEKDNINYTLTESYTHSNQGDYARLYFDIPDNVQRIDVFLEVDNDYDVIDLGLEDSEGLRGWSGGARKHLCIMEDWATQGYSAGKFYASKWAVLLGLYKIKTGCKVKVEIRITLESPRWYKGDLHMHSSHSDGAFELQEVIANAKGEQLDFIALTDHNTFSQNHGHIKQKDLVIIEGVELTTYHGHVNFWGVHRPFSHFVCESKSDMLRYVGEGREKGAIVSVNHPFHQEAWEYGFDGFNFEFVEIWNGPWGQANKKAVDWWHQQLVSGKRMIAVGGSDTHRQEVDRWYGTPTNWIESCSFSTKGILDGLRRGRVCVSANPRGVRVDILIGDIGMGDVYQVKENRESDVLSCEYYGAQNDLLRLYSDNGLIKEVKLTDGNGVITSPVSLESSFYRVEIVDGDNQDIVKCISNALFIR